MGEVLLHRQITRRLERRALQGYLTYKKPRPLGPYSRTMPTVLGGSYGGGRFLMGEVPLYRQITRRLERRAPFRSVDADEGAILRDPSKSCASALEGEAAFAGCKSLHAARALRRVRVFAFGVWGLQV